MMKQMEKNKHQVKITKTEILADDWYTYKKISFDLEIEKNQWESQTREVLDRGDGATILLFNKSKRTVILTRQFRLPTYLNRHETGMMIEACAGSIEAESALENILRETEEETGYKIHNAQKIFESYMSPGAVTEILHFFVAEYDDSMRVNSGGGNPDETEHIEVLELSFLEAIQMMRKGEISDAKTIMLLQYAQINDLFA